MYTIKSRGLYKMSYASAFTGDHNVNKYAMELSTGDIVMSRYDLEEDVVYIYRNIDLSFPRLGSIETSIIDWAAHLDGGLVQAMFTKCGTEYYILCAKMSYGQFKEKYTSKIPNPHKPNISALVPKKVETSVFAFQNAHITIFLARRILGCMLHVIPCVIDIPALKENIDSNIERIQLATKLAKCNVESISTSYSFACSKSVFDVSIQESTFPLTETENFSQVCWTACKDNVKYEVRLSER